MLKVAVPPIVKFAVSAPVVTPARVNVNTRLVAPSSFTDDGATATDTSVSSLVIVPVADAGVPMSYGVPAATFTMTVSSGYTVLSAVGSAVTAAVVLPAGIVTVPLVPLNVAAPVSA